MKKETLFTILKFIIGFASAILGGLTANAAVAASPELIAFAA